MAFDYTFEAATRLLVIKGTGQVSMSDRYNCVHRMAQDQSLPTSFAILVNVSEVTNDPSPAEINWIASLIQSMQAQFGGKVAIFNPVVMHASTSHMVAYSAQATQLVRAFNCEQQARDWLGN